MLEDNAMRADTIRERIRKQPFEPFRLYVFDGTSYDVLHYDFVFVMRDRITVAIGVPTADDIPQKSVDIDPLHITQIETIKPRRNGAHSRRSKKK